MAYAPVKAFYLQPKKVSVRPRSCTLSNTNSYRRPPIMLQPSSSKSLNSAISSLWQDWKKDNRSIYQITVVPLLKHSVLSKEFLRKMIGYLFIATLVLTIQRYLWIRYDFSLVPVIAGMFCLIIFLWLLAVLQEKMKDEPSTTYPPD